MSEHPSFERIKVRWVLRGATGAALAGALAVPFGLWLSSPDELDPLDPPEPLAAVARGDAPERAPSRTPRVGPNRPPWLDALRELSSSDLLGVAGERGREPVERLAAINLLWARGERRAVERLTADSGERLLAAKLEALRGRRSSW